VLTLSAESFVSQIFLVENKEGGQRLVINLKCLNSFVKTEHLKMEGLHILPHLVQKSDWMIKMDLKDAYLPQREPTPPPVSMGRQTSPISVSPIWTDFSPPPPNPGLLEGNETCGRNPRAYGSSFGDKLEDLLILHKVEESDKVCVNSTTENGILRVFGRYSDTTSNIPSREVEEDSTIGISPPSPTKGLSERHTKVRGQSLYIHKSNMASPTALQNTAVSGKLSCTRSANWH